ncbi:MAG: ABC transporter ATP-binding protein, partial [Thermoanaerobaculia bacterium]
QKKCLGKMGEVADREGRTVLFVSHNMAAVNRLCRSAMLLDAGCIKTAGETHAVTARYLAGDEGTAALRRWIEPALRPGNEVARLVSVAVVQAGLHKQNIDIRESVEIEMTYDVLRPGRRLIAACGFFDPMGVQLFTTADFAESNWDQPRPSGRYKSICQVPGNLFAEGEVRVVAELSTRSPVYEIHFLVFDSVAFQVVDKGESGSVRAGWGRPIPGVMRPMCGWMTQVEASACGESAQPEGAANF